MTIREAALAFRERTLDPVELTRACLDRIAATDDTLHAWVTADGDNALAAAAVAAAELRTGTDRGPLHGIPVAVKDIIDIEGAPTRCGSRLLANVPPAGADAAVVARLRAAGAVILGKTVTQEFAAGVLSPPARNPWDATRVPGGSSGGSAVAVATGATMVGLGSDTGGSIRIPAAAVGISGFKPSFGALDVTGVQPLAPSLDTLGPLARTVDDAAIAYRVLRDETHSSLVQPPLSGIRLGVPRAHFWDRLSPDVGTSVQTAIETFGSLGIEVVEVDWSDANAARASAFIINRVETARSLWPLVAADPARLLSLNPDLQVRVVGGRLVPAVVYLQAVAARERVRHSMRSYLDAHRLHAIATPTLPSVAVPADDPVIRDAGEAEPVGVGYTRLTMPFNATGQPVLSIPCGFSSDDLPIGIQLAGRSGDEELLFALGSAYERETGWLRRTPPTALTEA